MRGIAKAKVGQAGKKVRILVMLTLLLFCELGLTISIAVRYLALLESSYLACSPFTGIVLLSINGRTIILLLSCGVPLDHDSLQTSSLLGLLEQQYVLALES